MVHPRIQHLNRFWSEVADRFGIGSKEVETLGNIIEYWENKGEPFIRPSDKEVKAQIQVLFNEMQDDQRAVSNGWRA